MHNTTPASIPPLPFLTPSSSSTSTPTDYAACPVVCRERDDIFRNRAWHTFTLKPPWSHMQEPELEWMKTPLDRVEALPGYQEAKDLLSD